jgi:hypothetical protein
MTTATVQTNYLFDETSAGTIAHVAETLFERFLADQGWGQLRDPDLVYAPDPTLTSAYLKAIHIKTYQNTYQWELHWARTYGWFFSDTHWWSVHQPDSLQTLHAWTLKRHDEHLLYNFGCVNPEHRPPVTLKPSIEHLLTLLPDARFFRARWPHPQALMDWKAMCDNLLVVNLRDLDRFEHKYEQKLKQWRERRPADDPDVFSLEPDGTFRPDLFDHDHARQTPSFIQRDHLKEYETLYKPGMAFLEAQSASPQPYYVNRPISNGGKWKFRDDGPVLDWPDIEQVCEAARFILEAAVNGQMVLFHCRGGRHRTGMIALLLEKLHLMATGQDSEDATHQLKQTYACHVTGLDGHVSGFRPANLAAVNVILKDPERLGPLLALYQQLGVAA